MEHISPSGLSLLLGCPRKFQHLVLEQKTSEGSSIAVTFGQAWHQLQFAIQRTGSLQEAFALVQEKFGPLLDNPSDPKEHRTTQRLWAAINHYKEQWGGFLTPLMMGDTPAVEVGFLQEVPFFPVPFKGFIDFVGYCDVNEGQGKELWLVDYKTTSRLQGNWPQVYGVSNQFKGYYWAGKVMFPEVVGVLVDIFYVTPGKKKDKKATQKEKDGCNFYRLPLRYENFTITEWENNVATALEAAEVYAKKNFWPQNSPDACTAYFSNCPLLDVCSSQNPTIRSMLLNSMPLREEIED